MPRYVYGQTTGAGLGNELFPVIRAAFLARQDGLVALPPVWMRPRLGPWIRRERDKRQYQTLFRRPGVRAHLLRLIVLLLAQRFDESGQQVRRGMPGLELVMVKGMNGFFKPFQGRHDLVYQYLTRWSRSPFPPQQVRRNGVAMHVRLGDFARPQNNSVTGNMSTPLRWFADAALELAECGKSVTVFSDGEDSELSQLLSISGVSRAPASTALVDMTTMCDYEVVIGSQSTFSAWAAFLGDKPMLLFPGTNLYLDWSEKVIEDADGRRGAARIVTLAALQS